MFRMTIGCQILQSDDHGHHVALKLIMNSVTLIGGQYETGERLGIETWLNFLFCDRFSCVPG